MSGVLDGLLEDPIKARRGKGGVYSNSKKRASKVASYAPEVMVKITGNTKGAGHMQSHLSYISRNGDLEVEDELGNVFKGKEEVKSIAKDWENTANAFGTKRANSRNTTNIVLSMPGGTDAQKVKDSARGFAKKQFGENYQYVFALHTDTESPHVHLTVNNYGLDGRKLHVKKGDPQKWREKFAAELEARGVEAEATPRAVRGVIRKSVSQVIHNIRKKGIVPDTDRLKVKQILRDSLSGEDAGNRAWESRIRERQNEIRRAWLEGADDLEKSSKPEDALLATSIRKFVKDMPELKTERHEIADKLRKQLEEKDKNRSQQDTSRRSMDDQDREEERD